MIDGTQNATDTLDDANFVVRPLSRRLLIGGGAALGVGLTATALGAPAAGLPPARRPRPGPAAPPGPRSGS